MSAVLTRWCYHPEMGTFGTLRIGTQTWPTVEQPWRDNQVGKSCIPLGVYDLTVGVYYGGDGPGGKADYRCLIVEGVPDRSQIKVHRANRASELQGCIAPGLKLGALDGVWAVLGSQPALDAVLKAAGDDPGTLTVRNTDELGTL